MIATILASVIGALTGAEMARSFEYTKRVARWRDEVEEEICDAKLEDYIEPWVVLSLIHVESFGNPLAHRKGSQFYGMLQMGTAAAKDVGNRNSRHLHGRPNAAVRDFLKYLERYEDRHQWDSEWIAVLWKGGPGTLRRYQRYQDRGVDPLKTMYFSKLWKGSVIRYVRYFLAAVDVWLEDELEVAA